MNGAGKTIAGFFKRYWITILVYLFLIGLYAYVANNHLINAFLFPTTQAICKAFAGDRYIMLLNLIASLSILVPAIFMGLVAVGMLIYANDFKWLIFN